MGIVLFGCGTVGYEALCALGEENISCFCDNNISLAGKQKYGKCIISFEELKQKGKEAIVIICADGRKAFAIAEQCEKNGIRDYVTYQATKDKVGSKAQMLRFVSDPENRMNIRINMYISKANELQKQVDYFKKHADIRTMKSAQGKLRKRQLQTVEVATSFFEKISELNIKPFLYAGNLLGYVRHGGFIPWDDDVDFGLMREDYEKLRSFCYEHMHQSSDCVGEKKETFRSEMDDYFWVNFGDHIGVVNVLSDGREYGMDFFSMDCYDENYTFEELRKYACNLKEKLIEAKSDEEKRDLIADAFRENDHVVKESNHIYFGIDNMDIMQKYHRGEWISGNVVFPLRQIKFEEKEFWIPNDPEKFVQYIYEDIWNFPEDIGIPKHVYLDEGE